jgi:hypothetical protein
LHFAINARNFGATQEVGKKGENTKYYKVPLPNYFNLARLQLLLAIVVWEAKVVGKGSQGVWATCLIQCLNILSRIFLKTIHPSIFKKNLQGRKSLELGRLLNDLLIKKKWSQGKSILV